MHGRRTLIALTALATLAMGGCGSEFRVTGSSTDVGLTLNGGHAAVRAGDGTRFQAIVTPDPGQPVQWTVNGIAGGSFQTGRIDSKGNYRAPASVPSSGTVEVCAHVIAKPEARSCRPLTLWNPVPVITSATATAIDTGAVALSIDGSGFVQGASVSVNGSAVSAKVRSSTSVTASAPAPTGQDLRITVNNPEPGAAGSSSYDIALLKPLRPTRSSTPSPAARFLDQATFGATKSDVTALNQLISSGGSLQAGLSQWIDNQQNAQLTPPTVWYDFPANLVTDSSGNYLCVNFMQCAQIEWIQQSLSANDQLRQRTGFALSEIWVISGQKVLLSDSYFAYIRALSNDAFGAYDRVMSDVTLSSGMGLYLDMGGSAKPANGSIANENYARELMQLFTLGVYQLNDDGSQKLDNNGQPLATYTETDIQELARALTGWTFKAKTGTQNFSQNFFANATDRTSPMIIFNNGAQHDTGTKTFFAGTANQCSLSNGTDAQTDLNQALQCIFQHPNLPPFVAKQLIQHLVTSNPTPAYVQRVVNVFKDDGTAQHVRGNLGAVIKALLLDPEARQGDLQLMPGDHGHLREPVLMVTGLIRGLCDNWTGSACYGNFTQYTNTCCTIMMTNIGQGLVGTNSDITGMGQNILFSPSVFNYFPPDNVVDDLDTLGPEFKIHTTATYPLRANFVDKLVRNTFSNSAHGGSAIDVSAALNGYAQLAGNSDQLVNQVEQDFLHGHMPSDAKQSVINTVTAMPNATSTDALYRAKMALYLLLSSANYQVID